MNTGRIKAARYEIGRAMAEAEKVAGDRRHTAYRRAIAWKMAALGFAALALLAEMERHATTMNDPEGDDQDAETAAL